MLLQELGRAQTDDELRSEVERDERSVLSVQLAKVLPEPAGQLEVSQVTIAVTRTGGDVLMFISL